MIENLKERILSYMREEAYKPLLAEDVAEGMQLSQEELVQFWGAMEGLFPPDRSVRLHVWRLRLGMVRSCNR